MNQVGNIKSYPVYIATIAFSIICLHASGFLPVDAFYSSEKMIYGKIVGISLGGQPASYNLYAQSDGPTLTNPDWVPPVNRSKYPGYQIMEDAKGNSESWKFSTNRPGGKIKGGGTVKYKDYRSVTRQTRPESVGKPKPKK